MAGKAGTGGKGDVVLPPLPPGVAGTDVTAVTSSTNGSLPRVAGAGTPSYILPKKREASPAVVLYDMSLIVVVSGSDHGIMDSRRWYVDRAKIFAT